MKPRRARFLRLPSSYLGLVLATLGALVMLVSERPEVQRADSSMSRATEMTGQGLAGAGVAAMATRALAYVVQRHRASQPVATAAATHQDPSFSTGSAEENVAGSS